jgi:formylglycine-generating enzyme required for sulfatase activity
MHRRICLIVAVSLTLAAAMPSSAGTLKCPGDSVKVGNVCVDKYEASVWDVPAANTALVKKVQSGKATLADLTGGGATQVSLSPGCIPAFPPTFPSTGNWTAPLYAVSVAGVAPSGCATWFQAEQACRLSGKRLVTNQEWQATAAGTPDPGGTPGPLDCNTNSFGPTNTGSRTACVSSWGAFDMVGNLEEWVADWGDLANSCVNWNASFGSDFSCVGGPGLGNSNFPAALLRGGRFTYSTNAGVFAIASNVDPSTVGNIFGFRCAR